MHVDVRYATSGDGTRIAWSLYRGGDRTPLVSLRPPQFSHLQREWRMGFSHHEFEAFTPHRRVLRYDPRGTGLSSRHVQGYSIDLLVADLQAVLDRAGLDRVVLDAISGSAVAAIHFAVRHPERVERLILQNLFTDGAAWWSAPHRQGLLTLASIDWQLCTETLAWLTWPTGDRDALIELARHVAACVDSADFLALAACEAQCDLRSTLPQLQVPTLVVANPRFARMAPQDFNREAAATIPDAILISVTSGRERVNAIDAFLRGGRLPPGSSPVTLAPPTPPGATLSPRELEVLRLIAAGQSNRDIAEMLVLSVRTVDSHAARIYEKTQTRGRAEATAYAIRNGILDQIP